ncbi:MAG: hypothetical protein MZU97_24655 [Bacillus subtilis]|nr:hypothetical protein [Bacillus subtilis]
MSRRFSCVRESSCTVDDHDSARQRRHRRRDDHSTTTPRTTETTTSASTTTTTTVAATDYASIAGRRFATNNTQAVRRYQPHCHGLDATAGTIRPESRSTNVIPTKPFYGTGAALTLSAATRDPRIAATATSIIEYFFGPGRIRPSSLVRLTVGASDFMPPDVPHYTYNDTVEQRRRSDAFRILDREGPDHHRHSEGSRSRSIPTSSSSPRRGARPAWMKDNKSLYMRHA